MRRPLIQSVFFRRRLLLAGAVSFAASFVGAQEGAIPRAHSLAGHHAVGGPIQAPRSTWPPTATCAIAGGGPQDQCRGRGPGDQKFGRLR